MKICVDAGHGGGDPGALVPTATEKAIVIEHAHELRRQLKAAGHSVVMTRVSDMFLGLRHRTDIANAEKADVFVSLHCNADPGDDGLGDSEAMGFEVWYYEKSSRSKLIAERAVARIAEAFPFVINRGAKPTTTLTVLKFTNMPAILVEIGFIDSKRDLLRLQSPTERTKMAAALVSALGTLSAS
jgi:N-acetylmuramoyl-L-alanine amidase